MGFLIRLGWLALVPCLIVGCKGEDLGYGVLLQIDADKTFTSRADAAIIEIAVGGAETAQKQFPTRALAVGDEERVIYRPAVVSGTLQFSARIFDASLTFLGSGSATVALKPGKIATARILVVPGEDPRRCGMDDCTRLPFVNPGLVSCRDGACILDGACQTGRQHCSTEVREGCETALTDSNHCGGCDIACSGEAPLCQSGSQGATCTDACSANTMQCDQSCVDTMTDPNHCGSCAACAAVGNGTPICRDGRCESSCSAGYHLCGGQCVSNSDVATCGDRCDPCPTVDHANATCNGTACGTTCHAGYADCDLRSDTGCEASLADPAHCGKCETSCDSSHPVCQVGTTTMCATGCSEASPVRCGGTCTNTDSDPHNCGGCDTECSFAGALQVTCQAGQCQYLCDATHSDCDMVGGNGNGCETAINTTANCGGCGVSCTLTNAASATCSSGVCQYSCGTGYLDCVRNGANTDGCETSKSSLSNCGSCGVVCQPNNASQAFCNGTRCSYNCSSGSADCAMTGADVDGCESSLSSTSSCGACGSVCGTTHASAATCDGTSCSYSCVIGYGDCVRTGRNIDGCETSTTTTANCGACGTQCTVANATNSCSGTCQFSCNTGYVQSGNSCVPQYPVTDFQPRAFDVSNDGTAIAFGYANGEFKAVCFDANGMVSKATFTIAAYDSNYFFVYGLDVARSRTLNKSVVTWNLYNNDWVANGHHHETWVAILDANCNITTAPAITEPQGYNWDAQVRMADDGRAVVFYYSGANNDQRLLFYAANGSLSSGSVMGGGACSGSASLGAALGMNKTNGNIVVACESSSGHRYYRRFAGGGGVIDASPIDEAQMRYAGAWGLYLQVEMNDSNQWVFAGNVSPSNQYAAVFYTSTGSVASALGLTATGEASDRILVPSNGDFVLCYNGSGFNRVRFNSAGGAPAVPSSGLGTGTIRIDGSSTVYRLDSNRITKNPFAL